MAEHRAMEVSTDVWALMYSQGVVSVDTNMNMKSIANVRMQKSLPRVTWDTFIRILSIPVRQEGRPQEVIP